MKKKIVFLCIIVVFCIANLTGCSEADTKDATEKANDAAAEVKDQISNITEQTDQNILGIKNGYPETHLNITYGQAFEKFFSYPTFKSFVGENGKTVVEFTGYCTYQGAEVKAKLQFVLSDDKKQFQIGALSFNDVPQMELIKGSLLEKAFEEYASANKATEPPKTSELPTASEVPQVTEVPKETGKPVKAVDWEGTYSSGSDEDANTVKITNVTNTQFSFSIEAQNEGNTGEIKDVTAKIGADGKTATFDDGNGFQLKFKWKTYELKVTEHSKDGFNPYCGLNVYFEGKYWNADKLGSS